MDDDEDNEEENGDDDDAKEDNVDIDEKDKENEDAIASENAADNGGNDKDLLSVRQSGKKRKSSVDPTVLKARDVSSQLCYESITLIKRPETDLVWVLIEPRLRGQK